MELVEPEEAEVDAAEWDAQQSAEQASGGSGGSKRRKTGGGGSGGAGSQTLSTAGCVSSASPFAHVGTGSA